MARKARPWRGLHAKFLGFLLVFSVPALLVVEFAVLSFEYWGTARALDQGALLRQAHELAGELAPHLEEPPEQLVLRLNLARQHLEDPRAPWAHDAGYALLELIAEPIRLSLQRTDGSVMLAAQTVQVPPTPGARTWRARAALPGRAESLSLELSLVPPWRRVLTAFSFEWPVIVSCLLLVGLGAGWFIRRVVLRRLEIIAHAAQAWSRAEFTSPLIDASSDELGELSHVLNAVALELRERLRERARWAVLEERQRLARELHDSVKQHSFALELQLGAIAAGVRTPSPLLAQAISEAQVLSLQLRNELEMVLGELRAPPQGSLHAELTARAEALSRRSTIRASVHGALSQEPAREVVANLLKVVDEAIANAWQHSGASVLSIVLSEAGERASLRVQDDGCGMSEQQLAQTEQAEARKGMGMGNLRERVTQLPGGSLRLSSQPGKGTELEVSWRR